VLDKRALIGVGAMRCTACGAELILMKVVPDSVPSFEHHTFICSECHATELRAVFTRYGREADAEHMPMHALARGVPAWIVQEEHVAAPGLFGRVLARIRRTN
jgi:hypothetical protein